MLIDTQKHEVPVSYTACDRSMLSDMCALSVNLDEVRPWIRHLEGMVSLCMMSWSCHQTCGARGAATHASGAMRSDTRAATRLVSDWLLITINRPRTPLISIHPEHIKPTSKHKEKAKKERSSFDSFRAI